MMQHRQSFYNQFYSNKSATSLRHSGQVEMSGLHFKHIHTVYIRNWLNTIYQKCSIEFRKIIQLMTVSDYVYVDV